MLCIKLLIIYLFFYFQSGVYSYFNYNDDSKSLRLSEFNLFDQRQYSKDASFSINSNRRMDNRKTRFLSLFNFFQWNNLECEGLMGNRGLCLSTRECSQRGGRNGGPCAGGYGICCLVLQTCGSTVRQNATLFVNMNFPDSFNGTGTCQLTITKTDPSICQYRIDFDELILTGPEETNNICDNDQFIISGSTTAVPVICGTNSGNHVYLDAGELSNSIVLSVVTNGEEYDRRWKIRILQIPCGANFKAEDGCLQYFTGIKGRITSFNYDPVGGSQLANQDYSICIRAEKNFCTIQYSQCPDDENERPQSFTLSGNSNTAVPAMVGSTGSSNYCQADYLIIPMATNVGRAATGPSPNVDRICGGILSADVSNTPTTIQSTVRPFRMWFHTDNIEAPRDLANKGFCLKYLQQPCINDRKK